MDALPYLQQISLKREKIASFDDYPFSMPSVKFLEQIKFAREVTFIVGENGSGKSTLLEAIAVAMGFNPEGGTVNLNFETRSTHSQLADYLRLARSFKRHRDGFFLRAESFYNVATNIDEMDEAPAFGPPVIDSYGGVSLHKQSHGESFLSLMLNRFGGNGLYILDEPEAALSPNRMLVMLSKMNQLVKQQSQFIIATHSPILMAFPNAKILEVTQEGIQQTRLEDSEHFRLTRAFLNNPQRVFDELFEEGV
ncbi:AAA family ATPase [Psychrobium sp. MM17-31]|uniref:AAA family ATPase n=1 Tax=Psychrobium sp. MM17-31 TaxID=2917758 RepID=UPI001EF5C926|nr:AAA family ATPase [Psychrobium sp. MM17-31]MCG7532745.1 AAA family ATPase [Psychrobium sp. MM17-31]